MLILPVLTKRLKQGDDLALILSENAVLNDGDILVVSSKAIAMTEGAKIDLKTITPSEAAKKLSARCRQDPHFTQVVLDEAKRMNGETAGVSPHALLTSLRPNGMLKGRILCPNAGLADARAKSEKTMQRTMNALAEYGNWANEGDDINIRRTIRLKGF